uniref:Uncharacterized protein n=1 Tax=Ascaris lumbricoides TaxID=6252 RepID=A0A0M3I9R3_ASCLU
MRRESVKLSNARGAGLSHSLHRNQCTTMAGNSAIEPAFRRHSIMLNKLQNQSDVSASSSHQIQLQERTSSKITLDEELFDILYAFGLVI